MKNNHIPETVEERATLIKGMMELSQVDVAEFAYLQPMSPEDKTQFRTRNSMVKKPVKQKKLGLSFQVIELHIDFCRAFESGRFKEAVILYFQILTLTRR